MSYLLFFQSSSSVSCVDIYLKVIIFLQVLFLHNGKATDQDQSSRYTLSQQEHPEGGKEYSLTVSDATLDDSGVMECILTPDVFDSTNVVVEGIFRNLPQCNIVERIGCIIM